MKTFLMYFCKYYYISLTTILSMRIPLFFLRHWNNTALSIVMPLSCMEKSYSYIYLSLYFVFCLPNFHSFLLLSRPLLYLFFSFTFSLSHSLSLSFFFFLSHSHFACKSTFMTISQLLKWSIVSTKLWSNSNSNSKVMIQFKL